MAAPNMATITASLERSLKKCTLSRAHATNGNASAANVTGGPAESPSLEAADSILELNSQAALPLHWEQCLDLKTGEIYYINWTTGIKAKEDPRKTICCGGYRYDSEEDDCISYESVNSSSLSSTTSESPCSPLEPWTVNNNHFKQKEHQLGETGSSSITSANVLVVAGCKSCLMYYMVPKQHEICPKCCGQLLHFDRVYHGCC